MATWRGQNDVEILALLEKEDFETNSKSVDEMQRLGGSIKLYSCEELPCISKKKSPSLGIIMQAMLERPGYSYYIYINADIEIVAADEFYNLKEDLLKAYSSRVGFFSRKDYSSTLDDGATYSLGFDAFVYPSHLLRKIAYSQVTKSFQIGQAGWDYALPLSTAKEYVYTSDHMPLYHRRHSTGSDASWTAAMIRCIPEVHASWYKDSKFLSLLFVFLRLSLICIRGYSEDSKQNKSQQVIAYLVSRMFFFGFVSSNLLKSSTH